jgi:uncharacterized membrane protein YecN with MAPEG domain
MNVPFVVPFYAGIFALIYFFLTMRVARRRGHSGISLGSGGDAELERSIRAHGNFGEYVPFILLLLGFAELQHWSRYLLHALCVLLLIGRICHAIAVSRPGSVGPLRGVGMALTGTVIIIAALMLIAEFFLVLPTT